MSADGSRAGRIRAKLRAGVRITKAERQFLVEWERRRDKRGRKTAPVDIPPVEATIDDSPGGTATPTGGEQGAPPNGGASPPGPTTSDGPPPLSIDAPKPAPTTPTAKKADKPKVVPTMIGKQVAMLFTKGMEKWGESIKARGGTPYPDELVTVSAISAAWLADKYLGALGEEEALHWFNLGTPVGWNLWFGRKGAKPPNLSLSMDESTDASAKSADGPQGKPDESPKERSEGGADANRVKDPPRPDPITHNPSREEQAKIRAAMGSL